MYVIIYTRFCVRDDIPKARVPLAFEVDAFTRKVKNENYRFGSDRLCPRLRTRWVRFSSLFITITFRYSNIEDGTFSETTLYSAVANNYIIN